MKHSIISFALVVIVALTCAGRDRLYIEDFNIVAGETLQVPVILLNDTAYCGFQTDLYLPEGLSLDMEDGEFIIDLTSRKGNSHSVASRQLSDGAIRIYVSSLSVQEFSGNSGAIMTMSITAAYNFSGQAVIELRNSICAEAIGTRHVLANEICHVNPGVTPNIQGDVDGDGHVGMDDLTALINYLLTNDASGINLENADCEPSGSVNMDDLTALINFLLTNQWPNPVDPEEPVEPEGTQTITVNGVSFKMIPVEGGTFMMGATTEQGSDAQSNEQPAHEVTVSGFNIGQAEVTQELWQAVMGSNPSSFNDNPNRPVECVSWNDCQTFIVQLNAMTGKHFRLPTEAEWEFAARGGNKSEGHKFAGSDNIDEVGWYMGNIPSQTSGTPGYGTQPVAAKAPNELGLYDMSGNVWEWCQDWMGNYSSNAQIDPNGPATGTTRIVRGGSWINNYVTGCRVSRRNGCYTTDADTYLGLRLVLDDAEEYTVNGVSFTMVPVKGGTFMMGATVEEDADYQVFVGSPKHQVTLSDYAIGQTEVTQELWLAVMGSNPSENTGDLQRPVDNVRRAECDSFIVRLNALTGKHFRLPTEAEWEFAARGGNLSQGYTYAGSDDIDEVAWYSGNSGSVSHAVGTKAPNELGIYDMCGNVNEWCNDWYSLYTEDPVTNPTGPATGMSQIHRGGRYASSVKYCRITRRDGFAPGNRRAYLGFRIAQ